MAAGRPPASAGGIRKNPTLPGMARIVAGVLPVAVEGEDALALAEPGGSVSVLDGVDVGREVAGLDPLFEVLGGVQVRRACRSWRPVFWKIQSLIGWTGP